MTGGGGVSGAATGGRGGEEADARRAAGALAAARPRWGTTAGEAIGRGTSVAAAPAKAVRRRPAAGAAHTKHGPGMVAARRERGKRLRMRKQAGEGSEEGTV